DQTVARANGERMTQGANRGTKLQTQDWFGDPDHVIFIYNILELKHVVNQPPLFPALRIPACEKNQKFSVTAIPSCINEPYVNIEKNERYYKRVDGRSVATSLLNPAAFPSKLWNVQLSEYVDPNCDQTGNNLNALGVFWSLTHPEDPALEKELDLFAK